MDFINTIVQDLPRQRARAAPRAVSGAAGTGVDLVISPTPSESLAKEVEALGIKVTIVVPGGFRTDFASG